MSGIDIALKMTVAIVPPLLLLVITYLIDWKEREPLSLLCKLCLLGVGSYFIAYLWEMVAHQLFRFLLLDGIVARVIKAFLVIGVGEELFKFIGLQIGSWRSKDFDYRFDGIVYAVYVSLGFGMTENVFYVLHNGYHTALYRSISSVPLHASCGVIMGIFYGYAKGCAYFGNRKGRDKNVRMAMVIPMVVHGFYDFSMLTKSLVMGIIWIVFTIVLFCVVLSRLMKYSALDHKIAVTPDGQTTEHGDIAEDNIDLSMSPSTRLMVEKQRYESYGQTAELTAQMREKYIKDSTRKMEDN